MTPVAAASSATPSIAASDCSSSVSQPPKDMLTTLAPSWSTAYSMAGATYWSFKPGMAITSVTA